ncbi:MAG: autotransporter domain-containing protein [Betaproteobacteria bacterium]|nr:MAG: autotransporter domain-containing protein [Betaproteobacteria bacterium]
MRNVCASLAAIGIAIVASGNVNAQFSNFYFFGDSSTDAGAFGSRFTVNPGLVWSQVLGQRYGATITTSVAGGTDYAQGGARVTQLPGYPPSPPFATALSLSAQISQQLTKTPILDPNAIYGVSIGYNDLFTAVAQAGAGQITPAVAQANVTQAAVDAAAQVARLSAAGARYIVVLNLYDTGKSPAGLATPAAPFSALTSLYNSTLRAALAQTGASIISVNTYALFYELIASPAAYGFTNVTMPACTTVSSLTCTAATLVAPNAAQTYLFADSVHPTPAGHAIMAQAVASMLEGPAKMSVLAEAPLGVEAANFRAIDARMISGINSPRPMSKYEVWGGYDYGNNDFNGNFLSGNADLNTLTLGGDITLSPQLRVGAMFGYTENKGDFGGSTGGYKLKETSGTVYAGFGPPPWWFGVTLGAGDLDYSGIHRDITLGALTRSETADARGWHIMASVLGGYWFIPSPDWQHGPWVRVSYQDIHVHAFSENGADSTALSYGQQTRTSLMTSLGWQVTGRVGMFRPYARVTWENEGRNNERFVSASSVSIDGSYSIPGIKPDSNFVQYVVGASADFGRVTGFITGSGTSSKSDGNGYGVTIGVRVPI